MSEKAFVAIHDSLDSNTYNCTRKFKDHESGRIKYEDGELTIDEEAVFQWKDKKEEEKVDVYVLFKMYEEKGIYTVYGEFTTTKYIYNITVNSEDIKKSENIIEDISLKIQQSNITTLLR
jgi:hypothetical protein